MLTHEDTGFFLYSRQDGKFTRTLVHSGGFVRSSVKGLKGNTDDYWQFDGKLNLADYDNDGDLDLLVELPHLPVDAPWQAARLEARLQQLLGEQKIDVILAGPENASWPIVQEASRTGIPL